MTFEPTTEEFSNPLQYIQDISHTAYKYGIVKIVPPPGWTPNTCATPRFDMIPGTPDKVRYTHMPCVHAFLRLFACVYLSGSHCGWSYPAYSLFHSHSRPLLFCLVRALADDDGPTCAFPLNVLQHMRVRSRVLTLPPSLSRRIICACSLSFSLKSLLLLPCSSVVCSLSLSLAPPSCALFQLNSLSHTLLRTASQ